MMLQKGPAGVDLGVERRLGRNLEALQVRTRLMITAYCFANLCQAFVFCNNLHNRDLRVLNLETGFHIADIGLKLAEDDLKLLHPSAIS